MANIDSTARNRLYTQAKHLLGAPIRGIELEEEMMDTLLDLSILDYGMYVQDWLIENQWAGVAGVKSVSSSNIPRGSNIHLKASLGSISKGSIRK